MQHGEKTFTSDLSWLSGFESYILLLYNSSDILILSRLPHSYKNYPQQNRTISTSDFKVQKNKTFSTLSLFHLCWKESGKGCLLVCLSEINPLHVFPPKVQETPQHSRRLTGLSLIPLCWSYVTVGPLRVRICWYTQIDSCLSCSSFPVMMKTVGFERAFRKGPVKVILQGSVTVREERGGGARSSSSLF